MRGVYAFLGVRDSFTHPSFSTVKHASTSKRRLTTWGRRFAGLPDSSAARRLPPSVRRVAWRVLSHPFSTPVEAPRLDGALRRRILDALQPDLERFGSLTGRDVSAWLR
jgi:hypothetical protein